jgi:hypothetical protein
MMITHEQFAAAVVELDVRSIRAAIAASRALEERERRPGSCLLCEHDEPTATYRGRRWCRACGRTW